MRRGQVDLYGRETVEDDVRVLAVGAEEVEEGWVAGWWVGFGAAGEG